MTHRSLSSDVTTLIGQVISVSGWVQARRDHGGVIFNDVKEHTGIVQLVINPQQAEVFSLAEELRNKKKKKNI